MRLELFPILTFLAFSTFATAAPIQVVTPTDLRITGVTADGKEESYSVKAGETFSLRHAISRAEKEGHSPVILLLPDAGLIQSEGGKPVELTLPTLADWKGEVSDKFVSAKMDTLYLDFLSIMNLARGKKTGPALERINRILETYPKLASGYYVKAQIEVLDGRKEKALETLKLALDLKPDFKEALQLRSSLRGE